MKRWSIKCSIDRLFMYRCYSDLRSSEIVQSLKESSDRSFVRFMYRYCDCTTRKELLWI